METRITLPFADGDYEFWLPMPRVTAIEREAGRIDRDGVRQPYSIFSMFDDLGSYLAAVGDEVMLAGPSPAHMAEAHLIIRHGLIGGDKGRVNGEEVAVGDALARELVETYCYPARPAIYDLGLAWKILSAAVYGVADTSKKKAEAENEPEDSTKAGSL